MKTRKITLAIFLSIGISMGCENKLDLQPLGELNSETFYKTFEDFEAASLSPYSTILNLFYEQNGRGFYNGIEYPSDDSRHGGQGINSNNDFNWLPNNGDFGWIFSESYKGVMRSNVILNSLPSSELSDEDKSRFEAEAKFIRSYFYFILATNWGSPPLISELITTIADSQVGNSQPGEVLDLVEADLTFAKENLPSSWSGTDVGRATSGAAQAFLGKVYLYRQKYSLAATELNAVINSGTYSLQDNFGDNFSESLENNSESIFEIQFTRGDFNPWLPTDQGLAGNENIGHAGTGRTIVFRASCFLGNCAPGANGQGYGRMHVTEDLQNEFEENDPRIPFTFYREGDDYFGTPYSPTWSITGATPSKYLLDYVAYAQPNAGSNNERVIRLADVYLMAAEAELLGNNNVQQAMDYVNMVRRRADPTGEILQERSGSSSLDEAMEFIMHERRVELAFEGHRYADLVRWHQAGVINIPQDVDFGDPANENWSETNLLKPYPQRELDLISSLVQNPGY
ncbi:RagB/SusD family nutrient uptake outer membrane protein [Algoriphagus machipongonensis]|uniref:Outer membrane protein probably involved in nutrient binding n=1 Tax=Algoriphagus machipongonensis TaxID=388413 RepID=A3HRL0_9BACT|nr:RagB/SusD family nutrient uptake outer membrane protein [Algoriphagus machipongonensis]EAZ82478.1 putative outer membrane protein probably involved in nutrient binding [Algoriphagus machipongonensis]